MEDNKYMKHQRKLNEEDILSKDLYFGESYFDPKQLASLCEQIRLGYKYRNGKLLEIGVGNGFTSSFLKRSGIDVTTMDINPALSPDIVGSLLEEPKYFVKKQFNAVLCFEVLEHLEWGRFNDCIKIISGLTSNVAVISLPRARRDLLAVRAIFKLPKFTEREVWFGLERKKRIYEGHYWEIGSDNHCTIRNIKNIIVRHFKTVKTYVFKENRYHQFFICEH